jgi:protein TonB
VGKNSDVFSVGTLLLELLTGQPPPPDPLATLKGTGAGGPPPVQPEVLAVLRMTLSAAESRYQSSGDLRRELGKLLFSGPYSPSTFNLAYFLNDLFREEIEAETRARRREAALEAAGPFGDSRAAAAPEPPARPAATPAPPTHVTGPRITVAEPPRRRPAALLGSLLAAAAVAGGIYVVTRRSPPPGALRPDRAPTAASTPTLLPELQQTPTGPTSGMTEVQFRDEVSRRVALETERLVAQMRARAAPSPVRLTGGPVAQPTAFLPAPVAAGPIAVPTVTLPPAVAVAPPPAVAVDAQRPLETSPPLPPTRVAVHEGALVVFEALDSPPQIATIVKPAYPPLALKARIGGTVVLRVLVSEKGLPVEVAVLRGAPAGLDEAAIAAVRRWTFIPATKDGVAVRTWMTVPIPFEP